MIYTSINNEKIKDIKKLNIKKYRDLKKQFLIEGEHLVMEAYKGGYLDLLILEEKEALSLNIDTILVTSNIMKYISELEAYPKVMGICHKNENILLKGNKIVILDGIQDPGNLGTIIRSSVAFNVDTLVLSLDTVDLYNQKVLRSAQGLNFHLNIIRTDIYELLGKLKQDGYHIYGTNLTNTIDLNDITKRDKMVIIMGNEGNGISSKSLELCDEFISIKMNKKCESLNVAVATSIILYELEK